MAINVKRKKKYIHKKNFSIKNIGKIIKILFYESLFKFYKLKLNLGNKKYMVILCGHMFHSDYVEKWFDRKKE